eukprot:Em0006g464a
MRGEMAPFLNSRSRPEHVRSTEFPSTSAACQKSSDYNRTLLVPLHGTAAFVCNVTDAAEAQLNVKIENYLYWWPGMDLKSIAGIDPQLVDSNSTINVTVNGNFTFLNESTITCNCDAKNGQSYVTSFVTTIFIYDFNDMQPVTSASTKHSNISAEVRLPSQSPSSNAELTSLTPTIKPSLLVPLLVCVVVAPVGGLVIVVIIAIAIVAVVRRRRKTSLVINAPYPSGKTANPGNPEK